MHLYSFTGQSMAVYGYCRVSTQTQVDEGLSLDVQQRQILGYAQIHDLEVNSFFIEKGISGSKPFDERPEGSKLIHQLKSGDVVIAAKLDRVFRSSLDALQVVEQLGKKGVSLHLIDLGGNVTNNGISKLCRT